MRFIIYFLLFYFIIRLVRYFIYGPKPKRHFYVNFGRSNTGSPFGFEKEQADPVNARAGDPDEPHVGRFQTHTKTASKNKHLQNIQDADFEELKN